MQREPYVDLVGNHLKIDLAGNDVSFDDDAAERGVLAMVIVGAGEGMHEDAVDKAVSVRISFV